jgi:signal transduction histidine kinase
MRSLEELGVIAAIADELPAGVWVATAPEGRFVYANRAFEQIMGMGAVSDVAVGEYATPYGIYARDGSLYPEDKMPFVLALLARETVVVDDIVIHRRDGRKVFVRAFAKPMFDGPPGPGARITHVAIAFFDITREVEAEKARAQMEAQLAQAERLASVGMLAAVVAHEVNNPLAYLIGSLDVLGRRIGQAQEPLRASLEEVVNDARGGAARVRNIVRDLKVFSRVQPARSYAVDVRSAIELALNLAKNEIRHRARLVLDLGPVPRVLADEGRLGQLFLNLILNAAQAIPEGAADENEVRVSTATTPDGLAAIDVRDTGSGIPRDVVERIFDPFFTTKPPGIGTGLGLSICQAIVSDLSGRIEVRSTPGEGSTFRVCLPAAPPGAEARPTGAPVASAPGRRGAVLVVDDEPMILKVMTELLTVEHDVTCERTARDALERLGNGERFDAILCDLMMPQMTGMDLYDALLEIAPKQAQAMLFLTGGAFTARARTFLDRVPNATIEKPFDTVALLAKIRQIVG